MSVVSSSSSLSASNTSGLGLEQRVLRRARALDLPRGSLVIIGFSGGTDSLALAAVLRRVVDQAGVRLLAAHIDHALRDSSAGEGERAADLARFVGVPFLARRLSGDPRHFHHGVGLEEAARRERYWALGEIAEDVGASAVAVGHHLMDQAETVLLHLGRGSGLRGLSGMSDDRMLALPWWTDDRPPREVRIWRPFLAETRATLLSYLDACALVPIADPSNDDQSLRRNALRARVAPAMSAVFPEWAASLERFAQIVRADDEALEAWAGEAAVEVRTKTGSIVAATLIPYPLAIRRRIIRGWLREAGMHSLPSLDRIDAVLKLVERGIGGRRIEIGDGWTVRMERGHLSVGRGDHAAGHSSTGGTDPG